MAGPDEVVAEILRVGDRVVRMVRQVARVRALVSQQRGVRRLAFRRAAGPLVRVGGEDRLGRTLVSNTDLLSSDTATGAAGAEAGAQTTGANGGTPKRRAGLTGMVLAELRELAGELGITGTGGMRKGDLIAAIKERQSSKPSAPAETLPLGGLDDRKKDTPAPVEAPAEVAEQASSPDGDGGNRREGGRRRRGAGRPAGRPEASTNTRQAPGGQRTGERPPGRRRQADGRRG